MPIIFISLYYKMQNQDKQLISIANKASELSSTFGKDDIKIPVPQIKVVGSQSAGKSSLIERLLGISVTPTGDNMVTRTPINVRMTNIQGKDTIEITLSYVKNGALEIENTVEFNATDRDALQKLQSFKKSVGDLTDKITGGPYRVSSTPLFIDVKSNKYSNFSFVDLPGIIMTACTDKHQSDDLPEQIRNLIKKELAVPNTIALVVIAAGNDLETDLGIALINEVRKANRGMNTFATVGVLTKIDRLDSVVRASFNNLIAGKMINRDETLSSSLTMSEGFYVVNNVCKTITEENEYFLTNFAADREILSEKKYGLENLQLQLQSILASAIRKLVPQIKTNLSEILSKQRIKSQGLGLELKTDQEKRVYLTTTTTTLGRLIGASIRPYGGLNTQATSEIGKIQASFVREINEVKPFENEPDDYFNSLISGFDTYTLTPQITIEQLADRCMKDENKTPLKLISPIGERYVNHVVHILNELIKQLVDSSELASLSSYPQLKQKVLLMLTNKVKLYGMRAFKMIQSNLKTHGSFFWSTDETFKQILKDNFLPRPTEDNKKQQTKGGFPSSVINVPIKKGQADRHSVSEYSYEPNQIRVIISKYYETIVASMRDYTVKLISEQIIQELETKVGEELDALRIGSEEGDEIMNLIVEAPNCQAMRATLNNTIKNLETTIKSLNQLE